MEAFSASYLARIPNTEWLNLLFYGVISRSDVALLGDINVVGPGEIAGMRASFTLPSKQNFFHTLSVGLDYKHFGQTLSIGSDSFDSPITYFPAVLNYGASWQPEKSLTQFNATLTYGLRGFGSDSWLEWDTKRYNATPNFFILTADLSETYELPEGFQLYGKVGGQMGDQPLVSSEQFSLGGLQTVRGYLERRRRSVTAVPPAPSSCAVPTLVRSCKQSLRNPARRQRTQRSSTSGACSASSMPVSPGSVTIRSPSKT